MVGRLPFIGRRPSKSDPIITHAKQPPTRDKDIQPHTQSRMNAVYIMAVARDRKREREGGEDKGVDFFRKVSQWKFRKNILARL
jgi:hypothetical protein